MTAIGNNNGAGIGTGTASYGSHNTCGNITITADVIKVTANKGSNSINSIGRGEGSGDRICGTITIGGTVYWDGSNYLNGGDTYLCSNIIYEP